MFTGIITHIGVVRRIDKSGDWNLRIESADITRNLVIGASIACDGVCLTATAWNENGFTVQISQETLSRTTLGRLKEGSRINLERALKVGDELGGHFVSGHVDGRATLTAKETVGDSCRLTVCAPMDLSRFIAEKGSVTLDGVSLTVNAVAENTFSVNIIPHTLSHTTLGGCSIGDALNLEVDMIARYLARLNNTE